MSQNNNLSKDIIWCPCDICDVKMTCESNCSRFNEYVRTTSTEERKENFNDFKRMIEVEK